MEHVASLPSAASGRMSPEALGLAVLLHALAATALWWLATYRPIIAPPEDPVEILFEKPSPPDPPPPPQKPPQPVPQPAPPIGCARRPRSRRTSRPRCDLPARRQRILPARRRGRSRTSCRNTRRSPRRRHRPRPPWPRRPRRHQLRRRLQSDRGRRFSRRRLWPPSR